MQRLVGLLLLCSLLHLSSSKTFAQSITPLHTDPSLIDPDDEDSLLFAARNSVPIFLRILLPPGIREGYALRAYFGGEDFVRFAKGESDQERMDVILFDAEKLTHGARSISLLAAAFGVFEHRYIPLKMPGFVLSIPLTSETEERFHLRVSHLPEHIYRADMNDVDKLQHFFSSAWLKSALGMDWLVSLAGDFVEIGEETFLVGGSNDPRDKHANADGLSFGRRLYGTGCEEELDIAPSRFLTPNP